MVISRLIFLVISPSVPALRAALPSDQEKAEIMSIFVVIIINNTRSKTGFTECDIDRQREYYRICTLSTVAAAEWCYCHR